MRPSRETERAGCSLRARRLIVGPLAIIAELQRDAEIVSAELSHGVLHLVLRRRADPHLFGLNRRLHLPQLLVLEELDDFPRRLDWDALLNLDHPAHGAAGGGLRLADLEV